MDNQKTLDDILKGRFVQRVFQEESAGIDQAQVRYMSGHGFDNPDWYSNRSFTATEYELKIEHMLKQRFVDMKKITGPMGQHKKKSHPIHNKIIWGHYNNIVRQLMYGYTDAVKEQLKQIEE